MKTNKILVAITVMFLIICTTSCYVVVPRHDNGHHNGWYKHHKGPGHPGNGKRK